MLKRMTIIKPKRQSSSAAKTICSFAKPSRFWANPQPRPRPLSREVKEAQNRKGAARNSNRESWRSEVIQVNSPRKFQILASETQLLNFADGVWPHPSSLYNPGRLRLQSHCSSTTPRIHARGHGKPFPEGNYKRGRGRNLDEAYHAVTPRPELRIRATSSRNAAGLSRRTFCRPT